MIAEAGVATPGEQQAPRYCERTSWACVVSHFRDSHLTGGWPLSGSLSLEVEHGGRGADFLSGLRPGDG